jgi:asparagine synthetase B (glutamine-hydrolysing)
LNGSFLLAIYDLDRKALILVNDRFSSCPIFYYAANGYLIFGAQLKAIIQSHQVPEISILKQS